jgi:hypothetical protein
MKEIPMKAYWMGQDIDDLPRETLIEIIHYMQKQLDSAREATDSGSPRSGTLTHWERSTVP